MRRNSTMARVLTAAVVLGWGCAHKTDQPDQGVTIDLLVKVAPDLLTQTDGALPADAATPDLAAALPRVTFRVDTSAMADGKNKLAQVKAGEQVFLAGDLGPGYSLWNPEDPMLALKDEGGGLFSITLPLTMGQAIQYKFAKTKDTDDQWSNGEKHFARKADQVCTKFPDEAAGLFEVQNRQYTVKGDATLPTVVLDAFRDYAQTFGYKSCD